ncbi:hypothetical protein INS49_011447 [Diaporthe citri]|uniref:uncharacterized protein n=1 Tax=Diaporthe citri TaxID=83186 RepID=UPI001C8241B2|nr:uncharacterized protein INS49_011447 [Diaporthe citri]KAG6360389.1 hypothetical protein INS49_011447 [Diaporthe citri]
MISLAGKSALITGGSRGIGLAIATRLANEGASCLLVARNADTLKTACSQLPHPTQKAAAAASPSRPHSFFAGEAGDPHTWDAIGRQLAADGHEVDVLVNAAGVSQNSLLVRTDPADIAAILDTKPARRRAGVQAHRQADDAQGRRRPPGLQHRQRLERLTSALSQELGQFQIRVNALVPGYIQTQMIENLNEGKLSSQIPLGRVGRAEEVADAAYFLATNSYANNCVLNIDGGLSAANQGFVSRGSS